MGKASAVIFLALVFLSSPGGVAWSQSSKTTCSTNVIGQVNCHTTPSHRSVEACAGGDWFLVGCTLGEHRQAIAAAGERGLRKEVGEMLAVGDCRGANAKALRAGEFALAREIKELCIEASLSPPNEALGKEAVVDLVTKLSILARITGTCSDHYSEVQIRALVAEFAGEDVEMVLTPGRGGVSSVWAENFQRGRGEAAQLKLSEPRCNELISAAKDGLMVAGLHLESTVDH